LFVGVFMPIISVPLFGSLNYFQNGRGDGSIILVLAAVSVFLTLGKCYRGLWATGLLAVALLAFTLANVMARTAEGELADGLVQLQWGWAVLVLGAILVVAAAITAEVQSQPHRATALQVQGASYIATVFLVTGLATWGVPTFVRWAVKEKERQRVAQEREAQEAREKEARDAREKAEQEARARAAREASERAEREARQRAEREATNQNLDALPEGEGGPAEVVPPPWVDAATHAARQGAVRVRISGLRVEGSRLLIELLVENTGDSRNVLFRGWDAAADAEEAPRLLDDRGRAWRGIPAGQAGGQGALPPGRSVPDLVVFAVGDGAPEFLRLELPAARFGGTGQLRLQLPRTMLLLQAPQLRGDAAVGELRPLLGADRGRFRAAAARALGVLGPRAGAAASDLGGALKDEDGAVRAAAAEALGKIGPEARGAYPGLVRALGDPEKPVAVAAAAALERVAPPTKEDVAGLGLLLQDRSPTVRTTAATALQKIGPDASGAFAPLLGALRDSDRDVSTAAAATLKGLGSPAPDHVPALAEALKARTTEAREYALRALEGMGDQARDAAPALAGAVRDSDARLRSRAAQVLRKINPDAYAPALAQALRDDDEAVRRDAVEALVAAGPQARDAARDLSEALKDRSPMLRVRAARALWGIDRKADNLGFPLVDALQEKDAAVRREAASLLADMGPRAPRVTFRPLADALRDPDGEVRRRAVSALDKSGAREPLLCRRLIAALEDEGLREAVSNLLARVGEEAVPQLIDALQSEKASVRLGAVISLGKIGTGAKEAYQPLATMFRNDPDPEIRKATREALGKIRGR
jgi:HEAT repeat protein